MNARSRRLRAHGAPAVWRGQAMAEYLVLLTAVLLVGLGFFDDGHGVLGMLLEGMRIFQRRFSLALSLPL